MAVMVAVKKGQERITGLQYIFQNQISVPFLVSIVD